jgi:hypothetical protein
MAEENEHVQTLLAARDRMVKDRRELALALSDRYKGGHTENMRNAFIGVQDTIEAIERAIAHENYIESKKPAPFESPIGFGR